MKNKMKLYPHIMILYVVQFLMNNIPEYMKYSEQFAQCELIGPIAKNTNMTS
jgi:hypothetical protein